MPPGIIDRDFLKTTEEWLAARLEKLIYGYTEDQLEHGTKIIEDIRREIMDTVAKELYAELRDGATVGGSHPDDHKEELDLRQGMIRIGIISRYDEHAEGGQVGFAITFFKMFLKSAQWGSYNLTVFSTETREEADEQVEDFLYSNTERKTVTTHEWFNNGRT